MVAAELLPKTDAPAGTAARWVRACLAEAEALDSLAGEMFPMTEDPAADARAAEVRRVWECWADEAEAVLDRVGDAPDLDPRQRQMLAGTIRVMRNVIQKEPALMRRRYRAMEAGEYVTGEEARRELGLPRRA